jgi:signal transduction histidine kinase
MVYNRFAERFGKSPTYYEPENMKVTKSLELIYHPWQARIVRQLARGEELREQFEVLVNQFYNRLCQAVETGDATWLDPVLDDWQEAMPESERGNQDFYLLLVLDQIQQTTLEVAKENLENQEALNLLEALTPIFLHANQYSARSEHERRITEISGNLEQANKSLERLEKSKSKFIAIAAHELKTPLTLIEGYAAMLRDHLVGNSDDNQMTVLLRGIDNGTHRLREIINDMIDVSLIDNNLLALKFQPFWISRMLNDLRLECEKKLVERRLTLTISKFDGGNVMNFGDGERLYQAFRNIILNAIKYTPDGGIIDIDGRLLPGFIEVTIRDTGIGIASEDQIRIFEKFSSLSDVSLHSSGKTKFKGGGAGLGLPITRGIIEAHGGSIWVESDGYDEVNCPGATFHVLLPMRKMPPDDRSARLFGTLSE